MARSWVVNANCPPGSFEMDVVAALVGSHLGNAGIATLGVDIGGKFEMGVFMFVVELYGKVDATGVVIVAAVVTTGGGVSEAASCGSKFRLTERTVSGVVMVVFGGGEVVEVFWLGEDMMASSPVSHRRRQLLMSSGWRR